MRSADRRNRRSVDPHGYSTGLPDSEFSYSTTGTGPVSTVINQAREAEAAGFDAVFVRTTSISSRIGGPTSRCSRRTRARRKSATATESIQLSALVTGNTYRKPAMLAKTVSTLDVVSGGRAGPRYRSRLVRTRTPAARIRVRYVHRPISNGSTRRCRSSP
ncbi:LLM class flavin-dependent oxidoreductase, partial [Rhodococcus hoagii]|nr:LLM class flavin-dependent oxidoreductase [Prescottella equi]